MGTRVSRIPGGFLFVSLSGSTAYVPLSEAMNDPQFADRAMLQAPDTHEVVPGDKWEFKLRDGRYCIVEDVLETDPPIVHFAYLNDPGQELTQPLERFVEFHRFVHAE